MVEKGAGGGRGGRPRSLRDWKRVSHHYCHRATHSGHSAFTHQSALAQSVCWVTLCLSPHPSISASFILHQRTQARCLPPRPRHSQSPILFASAGNLSSSLHQRSPSPAVPVSPVILVPAPAALGCPLFPIQPSSHPTPWSRTLSCGSSGERRKTLPHE